MQSARGHNSLRRRRSDRSNPRGPVADQGFYCVRGSRLCGHPLLLQSLEPLDIELHQQPVKREGRRGFGDLGAQELIEHLVMALLLRRSLRLGKAPILTSEPWLV
jgi:hypothetical protein